MVTHSKRKLKRIHIELSTSQVLTPFYSLPLLFNQEILRKWKETRKLLTPFPNLVMLAHTLFSILCIRKMERELKRLKPIHDWSWIPQYLILQVLLPLPAKGIYIDCKVCKQFNPKVPSRNRTTSIDIIVVIWQDQSWWCFNSWCVPNHQHCRNYCSSWGNKGGHNSKINQGIHWI